MTPQVQVPHTRWSSEVMTTTAGRSKTKLHVRGTSDIQQQRENETWRQAPVIMPQRRIYPIPSSGRRVVGDYRRSRNFTALVIQVLVVLARDLAQHPHPAARSIVTSVGEF